MWKGILVAVFLGLLWLNFISGEEQEMPEFTISKIATTPGGWHSTTRGTIRLVFIHQGKWLVFRGGPNTYHFSEDGINWTATEAPQASRSHLLKGDTIYTQYDVLIEGEPVWKFDRFVCKGTIKGQTIHWEEPTKLNLRLSYYPDLQQDTNGYFTMTGRAVIKDEKGKVKEVEILWARSKRPNDITAWGPEVRGIPYLSDMKSSEVHENVPLEEGKSYILGMLSVEGVGKLFGRLFDGERGLEPAELSSNMSTVRGTDRRMCAVFDPRARVIHLAYVDGTGWLWYRTCKSPYRPQDWSEPLRLHPFKTFTVVISLDASKEPAHIYLLFGKTFFEDKKDLRNTYGQLYLQRFDGEAWSEPLLVSEPGTADNWYPNMNQEVSRDIGILYLKGSKRTRQGEPPPLDIMFSSTGRPK